MNHSGTMTTGGHKLEIRFSPGSNPRPICGQYTVNLVPTSGQGPALRVYGGTSLALCRREVHRLRRIGVVNDIVITAAGSR